MTKVRLPSISTTVRTNDEADRFIDLLDVPHSYIGQAGLFVRVKLTEDGLEFVTGGSGGVTSFNTRTGAVTLVASDITSALSLTQGSALFAGSAGAISQDNSNYFYDVINHRLGLGTTSPTTRLTVTEQATIQTSLSGSTAHFVGTDANPLRLTFDTHNNASSSGTAFMGRRSRGTASTPLAVSAGDVLISLNGRGYGTNQYAVASTAVIDFIANQTFTNTANGSYIKFSTTPDNSVTAAEAFRIGGDKILTAAGYTTANGILYTNGGGVISQATIGSLPGLGTDVGTWLVTPSWTNFNSAITGTAPYWSLASGGILTGNNTLTGSFTLSLNNTSTSIGGQLLTTATTTLAALNIGSFAGDSSSTNNGDLFYNSSSNTLRTKINNTLGTIIWSNSNSNGTIPVFNLINGNITNSQLSFQNIVNGGAVLKQGGLGAGWFPSWINYDGAHTALTTAVAFPDRVFGGLSTDGNTAASTRFVTQAAGTVALQMSNYFRATQYRGVSATASYTDLTNIYVDAPTVGTNASASNIWASIYNGNIKIIGTRINAANLPTSSAGLATGDLWKNGNIINIV